MMNTKQIESAILQLPPQEFREIIDWLHDLDYQRWDEQIANDIADGKLDFLAQEAINEIRSKIQVGIEQLDRGEKVDSEIVMVQLQEKLNRKRK